MRALFTHCSARAPGAKLDNDRGSELRECRARPLRHVAECHVGADSVRIGLRFTSTQPGNFALDGHIAAVEFSSTFLGLRSPHRRSAPRLERSNVACGGAPHFSSLVSLVGKCAELWPVRGQPTEGALPTPVMTRWDRSPRDASSTRHDREPPSLGRRPSGVIIRCVIAIQSGTAASCRL